MVLLQIVNDMEYWDKRFHKRRQTGLTGKADFGRRNWPNVMCLLMALGGDLWDEDATCVVLCHFCASVAINWAIHPVMGADEQYTMTEGRAIQGFVPEGGVPVTDMRPAWNLTHCLIYLFISLLFQSTLSFIWRESSSNTYCYPFQWVSKLKLYFG